MDRKIEARNLLANMLGFTRHERLDVKKPGPPASPPERTLEELPIHLKPSQSQPRPQVHENKATEKIDVTKEVLPAHLKGRPFIFRFKIEIDIRFFLDNPLPKLKKDFHIDDDHAPHSVDTDFTYVYLKPA